MYKEIVAYEIMECDVVVGNSLEDIVCWYHNNITDLSDEYTEDYKFVNIEKETVWYRSDSELEFTLVDGKVSKGDCKKFDGEIFKLITIKEAFELECKRQPYDGVPFTIAIKNV